jgi:hypothetical protein
MEKKKLVIRNLQRKSLDCESLGEPWSTKYEHFKAGGQEKGSDFVRAERSRFPQWSLQIDAASDRNRKIK